LLRSGVSVLTTREPYEVRLTADAEKDLRRLRGWDERITRELLALEQNPQLGHTLIGSLAGARSLEFSLPGGAYRAAYIVREEARRCVVFQIGPHEGFYQKAERRYRSLRRRP
jgi:mRNA-degrading endonuclease RelE of RelBE toxin-antitoxin system